MRKSGVRWPSTCWSEGCVGRVPALALRRMQARLRLDDRPGPVRDPSHLDLRGDDPQELPAALGEARRKQEQTWELLRMAVDLLKEILSAVISRCQVQQLSPASRSGAVIQPARRR